jgi:hypothetical protein
MQADIIWTLIAFFLTILVLSYALGDNPLFRIATYLFIGVSAGYIAVLIIYQVLLTKLVSPILYAPIEQKLLTLIPLLLSALLIFKLFPRVSRLGNVPMALLVGVGAAVAIGGAISGTLFGQIEGAINSFDLSQNSGDGFAQIAGGTVLLLGSVSSLAYFHFGVRNQSESNTSRPRLIEIIARIGQVFITITLGALFAGVLSAGLTALIERIDSILKFFQSFFL